MHLGTHSGNACINAWFNNGTDGKRTPTQLIAATETEKIKGNLRTAFVLPQSEGEPCGRSFEDAFMLANPDMFPGTMATAEERAIEAYEEAKDVKKISNSVTFDVLPNPVPSISNISP